MVCGEVFQKNLSASASMEKIPGPAQQNNQRGNEKYVRRRGGEFVGVRKNREQRFAVADHVSHDQVYRQDERSNAREKSQRQEESAKKLDAGNEERHLVRHR